MECLKVLAVFVSLSGERRPPMIIANVLVGAEEHRSVEPGPLDASHVPSNVVQLSMG